RPGVAPPVREADDTRHHLVGDAHLDLDLPDAAPDARDVAVGDADPLRVRRMHPEAGARLVHEPRDVVEPAVVRARVAAADQPERVPGIARAGAGTEPLEIAGDLRIDEVDLPVRRPELLGE